MDNDQIIRLLVKIASDQQNVLEKLAQMGTGVRVRFHHPQFFARFAKDLFQQAVSNDHITVEVYEDRITFFDGSGTLGSDELRSIAMNACSKVEDMLNIGKGELFNYHQLEVA